MYVHVRGVLAHGSGGLQRGGRGSYRTMSLGLFILRLVVGLLFMGHGAQKLFGILGGDGPDGTGAQFRSIGLRPGKRNALIAGLGEFVGGLLVLLGWFTPLGAAAIIAVMLAPIWTVHARNGLWVSDGGFEYHLVVIAAVFALTSVGAGGWSLDMRWRSPMAARRGRSGPSWWGSSQARGPFCAPANTRSPSVLRTRQRRSSSTAR